MNMSADGYVTTRDGWPTKLTDQAFVPGGSHGIREFLAGCEAALMGRTTFEPALAVDRRPRPGRSTQVRSTPRLNVNAAWRLSRRP